jgi:zinc transporter 5/7
MAQTLVGLACGLFSSGYQSMWTRCLLELMACMVILFGQYSQKQALNFGGFSQEAELDTYRTASSLGSGYHRGKGLIPARLAHIFAVLWEKEDSRKILMFLLVNVSYMFIELAVGLWTNSLGLIGDAGHMLFDNGALVIGLVASYIGKLPADHQYTYGYGRVEVLSGFINSLLLLFISFHLMAEAVSRFTDPPEVKTDNLLLTSVIGLLVNLVGLVWFHDHVHAHGHGESCGSGSSHGHSHGDSHGHSHGGHGHNHGHSHASSSSVSSASNSNMYGVYLHVLADTLGSVGVIVSSLLIHFQQWHIADPLSSALISMLIFGSTVPLLKGTCGQLLQRVPEEKEEEFGRAINEILHTVTGVRKVLKWHFWRHTSDICIGSVHLLVDPTVNDQQILYQVQEIFQNCTGVNTKEYFSIQIQRDDTKGLQTLNQSHEHHEHGVPKGCSSAAHSHGHNNHNYHHGHNHVHEHDDQHHHEHEHTCMSTHEDPVEHNWRVQHPSPVPSFQQPFNQPSPPPCSFPSVPQPSNPFCASS